MDEFNPKKGQLLVAELALTGDSSFSRAIIYLTENNEEGSVGFILNKPTSYKLSDLLPEIKFDFNLYKGGPVDMDNLYYIHKIPDLLPGCVEVDKDIFWGGDFETLYDLLKKGSLSPKQIKFFLGYSGWMPRQLKDELSSNSWIISDNDHDIFHENDASIWKEKLKKLGGEYLIWANSPENPSYN